MAEEATSKELKQIYDMGTYQAIDAIKLTQKGKNASFIFPDVYNRKEGWQNEKPYICYW